MSGRSSIDLLRRLAPVSDADGATVFGISGREELLADLTSLPFGRGAGRRPATRQRRLVLAVAVLAVAAIATAATWVVLNGAPGRETTSVQCVIAEPTRSSPRLPAIRRTTAPSSGSASSAPAPALVAYDNSSGGVTVLPRSAKPPAGWKTLGSQDVALIQLQGSLDDYVHGLNSSCLGNTAATAREAKLARFGFTGWTVTVRSEAATGTRTCFAGDVVEPSKQTVTLIPTSVATGATPKSGPRRQAAPRHEALPGASGRRRLDAGRREQSGAFGVCEDVRARRRHDNSLRCASIYETVGGTIFLTVRGPSR